MGTKHNQNKGPSVPSLGREDREDIDSSTNGGEVKGKDLSDSNKEESYPRVARHLREVDSRYSFRGNKLRVYPQNEEEL